MALAVDGDEQSFGGELLHQHEHAEPILRAEPGLFGEPRIGERQIAGVLSPQTDLGIGRRALELIRRDDEQRRAQIGARGVGDAGQRHREVGGVAERDEAFMPIQHIAAVHLLGAGRHGGQIGPRPGLGQRERAHGLRRSRRRAASAGAGPRCRSAPGRARPRRSGAGSSSWARGPGRAPPGERQSTESLRPGRPTRARARDTQAQLAGLSPQLAIDRPAARHAA